MNLGLRGPAVLAVILILQVVRVRVTEMARISRRHKFRFGVFEVDEELESV